MMAPTTTTTSSLNKGKEERKVGDNKGGIGGYLHMKYYVGQRDKAHLWKCQPNNWLPRRDEIHEIVVGWFSLTLGSVLSAGLATWIFNGGYTSLYFEFGKHGVLWTLLEFPLVFIPTDYITYWLHRIYH